MRLIRTFVLGLAVLALLLLLASGTGTRADLWSWKVGLQLFTWAAWIGLASAGLALGPVALLVSPRWRARPWVPVLALALGLAAAAPAVAMLMKAKSLPYIHDITTDTSDPPAFVALLPARKASPNGAEYDPKVAALQQQGYPDIQPLMLKAAPAQAMQRALDVARESGWNVVASDASAGRIEATATTTFFGFKDDIVVRIRPDGAGASRVDVRSVSRVGLSDIGTNAARIREFLARLA
jgi:uncharacterized protein (DUF1499 family)